MCCIRCVVGLSRSILSDMGRAGPCSAVPSVNVVRDVR